MAENINISNELYKRLQGKIPASIKEQGVDCKLVSVKENKLELFKSNVVIKYNEIGYLPDSVYYDIYKNINCTPERRGWNESLALTKVISLTRSVTFSKTVTTSFTVNASFNFSMGVVGGSTGGSVTRSISVTNSQTWSETETVSENRSRMINTDVQANKILFVKLQKVVNTIRVPFTVTIIVDGIYNANYRGIRHVSGPIRVPGPFGGGGGGSIGRIIIPIEKSQPFQLSDILSEAERTFVIDGYLQNMSADELTVLYSEKDATPEQCALNADKKNKGFGIAEFSMKGDEILNDDGSELDVLLFNNTGDDSIFLEDENEVKDEKFNLVIEEYFGSVTLNTSDSIANIEVRHLSFGPGFCNVQTLSSLGKIISTNAPPVFWGEWQVLESHFGEISLTITNQVGCDTGVRSQVRYWKKV